MLPGGLDVQRVSKSSSPSQYVKVTSVNVCAHAQVSAKELSDVLIGVNISIRAPASLEHRKIKRQQLQLSSLTSRGWVFWYNVLWPRLACCVTVFRVQVS